MSASNAGRIGIWGASGSGKSAYVKRRIKGLQRVIVFDPNREYAAEKMVECTTVEDVRLAMRAKWKTFRIAYVPPPGKEPRALSQLCRFLIKAQEPFKSGKCGLCTLVVEEMNLSFPVHGGDAKSPGFAEVCSRGRHSGIEVLGLSQRIAEVSTRFRGNCTETVVLRQQGARDVAAAAETIGVDKARVSGIAKLEYLHEVDGVVTPGKISFSRRRVV